MWVKLELILGLKIVSCSWILCTSSAAHHPWADYWGIKFNYTENKEPLVSNPSTWIAAYASMNAYYSPDTHWYLRLAAHIHGDCVQFILLSGSCWVIRVCAGALQNGFLAISITVAFGLWEEKLIKDINNGNSICSISIYIDICTTVLISVNSYLFYLYIYLLVKYAVGSPHL
jgi:hypothetical protein